MRAILRGAGLTLLLASGMWFGYMHPNVFGWFSVREASTLDLLEVLFEPDGSPKITTVTTLSFAADGRLAREDLRTVHAQATSSKSRLVYDPSSGQGDIALDWLGSRMTGQVSEYKRRMLLRPHGACVGFADWEVYTGTRTVAGVTLEVFRFRDDSLEVEIARSPAHGCWPVEKRIWGFDGRELSRLTLVHATSGIQEEPFDVSSLTLVSEPPEEFVSSDVHRVMEERIRLKAERR